MLMCIPDILDWPTLKKIRAAVNEIGFDDGRRTAGRDAKRVKHNLELKTGSEKANEIQVTIIKALQRNMTFRQAARPFYTHPPLISRYLEGMDYGLHVDDPLMGRPVSARSDVSVTVAISSPDEYDGGELVIHTPFGEQEVKLPAGSAVIYSSNSLHRVAPVSRGERLAAVTWVQSYVRNAQKREILYDLYRIREKMSGLDPDALEFALANKTYVNLLRMWSET